ncbi:MAG: hypothetical protein DRQ88_07595 [Epsilonproteobacteria bacterium]|nr:MAG: hypothetical protein DRQ89_03350 [Campylobacterota bacterium]RLA66187.1 MAG: hypothetical protein DRQ88_07595 [Campylobacterota bacterium]
MSRKRSILNRGKRRKEKVVDLDITSLLDVLVILLVFLLKSYSATGELANIPKGITLPKSESETINSPGVVVQASKTKIWVNDEEIIDTKKAAIIYDDGGKRIPRLYNKLVEWKEKYKNTHKSAKNAKKFSGSINLVLDKEIKYNYLKSILNTAADAGYKTYQFVVRGEDS